MRGRERERERERERGEREGEKRAGQGREINGDRVEGGQLIIYKKYICSLGPVSQSPFFNDRRKKNSDKSVDNQSEAWISVAYNKNCHLSLMTSYVKRPQMFLYCPSYFK